jgi:serpin B
MRGFALLLALGLVLAACGGGPAEPTDGSDGVAPPESPGAVALSPSGDIERAQPASDAPVEALARGFNDAGFDLLRTQSLRDNLVFSSLSVGHALLMARAAADDLTGEAIDAAFSFPQGLAAHEAWNASDQMIAGDANRDEDITVSIADRIWPRIDLQPDQEWIDLLASHHGASTEALDFSSDPEGSRETINSWVSEQTDELIPELLPEGFIKPGTTILVLTDAIYFKAQWETVFGKYANVEDAFTRLDGSTVNTEYMRELELADRRGVGDGFVGAEIPYVGGDFSMLVIVPDEGRFEEVRQRLDQDLLDEIDATFTTGPYELLIPKWETTTQLDLIEWLTDMGAAPGSYPAISPDAFLGEAVHGADIAVDEWGTVAAAATALGFRESGPPEPELTVKADRPFYYVIRHRPTGLALFTGQITDPTT